MAVIKVNSRKDIANGWDRIIDSPRSGPQDTGARKDHTRPALLTITSEPDTSARQIKQLDR